jgi:hypothetical protein
MRFRANRSAAVSAALVLSVLPAVPASGAPIAPSVAGARGDAAAAIPEHARLTFRGLGPVRVGMTRDEVEAVVGHRIPWQDNVSPGCATSRLAPGVWGLFTEGRVASVNVTRYGTRGQRSADYRTRAGVGVGMAQRKIRAVYGSAAKRSPHAYVDGYYFKITRGNRRIVFATDKGVITDIAGGRRPEVDYIEGCA